VIGTDFARALTLLILVLGIVNLSRMAIFMVGSDWQDVHRHRKKRRPRDDAFQPSITVIIPAHNEELVILRALESVYANDYAAREVIVVDDGSRDRTLSLIQEYKHQHQRYCLRIESQPNQGKAVALNRAIALAKSELVMVLDADSLLHPGAISEIVTYFRDPQVMMAATNVKILKGKGILNLAQRFEYLVGHRLKRSLTAYNCEYIVGGVGSTFRRSAALEVGCYDTDTMTEDIDFTLKMIRYDNRSKRVIFAPSAITYTESVLTFRQLITQRFRWKYGRLQTFRKNSHLFFSLRPEHDKRLTWMNLPFALYSELAFLLEPLVVLFVLYVVIYYQNLWTLLSAYAVMTTYSALNVLAEGSHALRDRLKMMAFTPVQYPLLLIISLAEYCALLMVIPKLPDLIARRHGDARWEHVTRAG
jgi:poly-beta-1,6-N-acetyl-D-glucosamine synthase